MFLFIIGALIIIGVGFPKIGLGMISLLVFGLAFMGLNALLIWIGNKLL